MPRFLLVSILFMSMVSSAQTRECNCSENLKQTIVKTEENYAGFPGKVNSSSRSAYNVLVNQLTKKATAAKNAKACFTIIADYVRFFYDKHFSFSYYDEKDFDSSVVNYDENYFKKGLAAKTLHPAEGIYVNAEGTTKLAVIKAGKNSFKGVKIESREDNFPKGFVYFTLTPSKQSYVVKEYKYFTSTRFPAKFVGNLLRFWDNTWGKIYPTAMTNSEQAELSSWKNNNHGLSFKKIADDVSVLKITTFMNNDDKIQQLVAANDSVIRNTKYLVVDLTGNGGGGSGWISFLPYLMTDTVFQYKSLVRVTPDNVKAKLADIEPFATAGIPSEYRKYFPTYIEEDFKKAYKELPTTTQTFYALPSPLIPMENTDKNPQKVALLVDDFCGSSAEYFFFLAKQSRKTISYGSNTIGMMDYEGMGTPTPLPYDKFYLKIPISKSSWTDKSPIDKTGFQPQVTISKPQDQWLNFVIDDLRKR